VSKSETNAPVVKDKKKVNQKASDFSNVGDWPMLIGGKPAGNETKRSTKKQQHQRSHTHKEDSSSSTSRLSSSAVGKTGNKTTATTASTASASSASISATNSSNNNSNNSHALKEKENHDPKSNNGQSAVQTSVTVGGNSEATTSSNGGNGINKKIPKHKWRPLQIDLAKSSRSKSIGRPTRRGISSQQQRYHERTNQRNEGNAPERRSNAGQQSERSNAGGGHKKAGGHNERIDSWRSGGGTERSNDREYERSSGRTQRRFRTSYRGGRQGRGGFSRSGPGRTTYRIPRHLLVSGEYPTGTDQSYILMGTHYYGPMPAAYIEMDAQSVKEAIKKQVEYYFSEENLTGDFFLRRKMDDEGCIPVTLIASFHRVLALTTDVALIITAIKESEKLELLEGYKVRTKTNPTIWPIKDVLDSTSSGTPQSLSAVSANRSTAATPAKPTENASTSADSKTTANESSNSNSNTNNKSDEKSTASS
ncbi:hypothetical protein DOY81_015031, partial [Sarcophaga bullata]